MTSRLGKKEGLGLRDSVRARGRINLLAHLKNIDGGTFINDRKGITTPNEINFKKVL